MALFNKKVFVCHSHHFIFILIFIIGVYLIWLDSRSSIDYIPDNNKVILKSNFGDEFEDKNVKNEDKNIVTDDSDKFKNLDAITKEEYQSGETENKKIRILVEERKLVKGDSLENIMHGKVSKEIIEKCLKAGNAIFRMNAFRIGHEYFFAYTNQGQLERFEYEIDSGRHLVIEGTEPKAAIKNFSPLTTLEVLSIQVDQNLYNAVSDAGEKPQIAEKVIQIFGSVIDFGEDLHEGDQLTLLIERRFRDEKYIGYGRILACVFHVKQKTFYAYLFNDSGDRPQYYNESGKKLRKTFFKAPLSIIRVTSKFSHARRHPISGDVRPHLGVDYAAPTGTPVRAVADGVVERCGWSGGYGKQVIIRHNGGIESWYSHLASYSIGLKDGDAVDQGKIIGYVGSTGSSTGPHLDFRLKKGDDFVNPEQIINHANVSQEVKDRKNFERVMRIEREYLEGKRSVSDYKYNTVITFGDLDNILVDSKPKDKSMLVKKESDKYNSKKTRKSKKYRRKGNN